MRLSIVLSPDEFGYFPGRYSNHKVKERSITFTEYLLELTQFSESQYRYLLSRLRRVEGFPVPLRVRSTSNPGGAGHDWVRERFPIDAPGVDGCRYIPAKLGDNPHLDSATYARIDAERMFTFYLDPRG